jgi:hypothetical protein
LRMSARAVVRAMSDFHYSFLGVNTRADQPH